MFFVRGQGGCHASLKIYVDETLKESVVSYGNGTYGRRKFGFMCTFKSMPAVLALSVRRPLTD